MYDIPEHQPYQYIRVCAIKREGKNDRTKRTQDEINVFVGVIRLFICSFVIVFICVVDFRFDRKTSDSQWIRYFVIA
jgi:hypothetical protein